MNLTQGVLIDYKQIGNLTAFVGNTNFEFSYVGGVFGYATNETYSFLIIRSSYIGTIHILSPGLFILKANVVYTGLIVVKCGTLDC